MFGPTRVAGAEWSPWRMFLIAAWLTSLPSLVYQLLMIHAEPGGLVLWVTSGVM